MTQADFVIVNLEITGKIKSKESGLKGRFQVSMKNLHNRAFEKTGQHFQVCKTCFDIPMSSSFVDISYNLTFLTNIHSEADVGIQT